MKLKTVEMTAADLRNMAEMLEEGETTAVRFTEMQADDFASKAFEMGEGDDWFQLALKLYEA